MYFRNLLYVPIKSPKQFGQTPTRCLATSPNCFAKFRHSESPKTCHVCVLRSPSLTVVRKCGWRHWIGLGRSYRTQSQYRRSHIALPRNSPLKLPKILKFWKVQNMASLERPFSEPQQRLAIALLRERLRRKNVPKQLSKLWSRFSFFCYGLVNVW